MNHSYIDDYMSQQLFLKRRRNQQDELSSAYQTAMNFKPNENDQKVRYQTLVERKASGCFANMANFGENSSEDIRKLNLAKVLMTE